MKDFRKGVSLIGMILISCFTLYCGGSSVKKDITEPCETSAPGEVSVIIYVDGGEGINGFEIRLDYDRTYLTFSQANAGGIAIGFVCMVGDHEDYVSLGCISGVGYDGPGEIAHFQFTYECMLPVAENFLLSKCEILDENGFEIQDVSCTSEIEL